MSEASERPAWRISFRALMGIVLALFAIAFVAGRYVYARYGGYRPLALVHVPANVRYRARVELSDSARAAAIAPLLKAVDPRGARRAALEQKLGVPLRVAAREVAFGVGPNPSDFVLVLGLQRQAGTGLPPARALCDVTAEDEGLRPRPTAEGCRFEDGSILASTASGAIVLASREALVEGLLGVPDLGDRLGFSGPSVRGTAPEVAELGREAAALGTRLAARYP